MWLTFRVSKPKNLTSRDCTVQNKHGESTYSSIIRYSCAIILLTQVAMTTVKFVQDSSRRALGGILNMEKFESAGTTVMIHEDRIVYTNFDLLPVLR